MRAGHQGSDQSRSHRVDVEGELGNDLPEVVVDLPPSQGRLSLGAKEEERNAGSVNDTPHS